MPATIIEWGARLSAWVSAHAGAMAAAVLGVVAAVAVLAYVRERRKGNAKMRRPVLRTPGAAKHIENRAEEPMFPQDAVQRGVDASAGEVRGLTLGAKASIFAAMLATLLAYEAIHAFVVDKVGLPEIVAVVLAGFLEAAAIASALLARDAIRAGRREGIDLAATWAFAAVSASIAALNELVTVDGWDLSPMSLLAAGFRTAPAFVACWLWGRSLHADRAQATGALTLRERRRSRRIHAVALAALRVRRLAEAGRSTTWAQARSDRRHAALCRHYPPTIDTKIQAEVHAALVAYGAVDGFPAMTRPTTPTSLPVGAHVTRPVGGRVASWALVVPTVGAVVVAVVIALPTWAAMVVVMTAIVGGLLIAHRAVGADRGRTAHAGVGGAPTVEAHAPTMGAPVGATGAHDGDHTDIDQPTVDASPAHAPASAHRGRTIAHALTSMNAAVGAAASHVGAGRGRTAHDPVGAPPTGKTMGTMGTHATTPTTPTLAPTAPMVGAGVGAVGAHGGQAIAHVGATASTMGGTATHVGVHETGAPTDAHVGGAPTAVPMGEIAHAAHLAVGAHDLPETIPHHEGNRTIGLTMQTVIQGVMILHDAPHPLSVAEFAHTLGMRDGTARRYRAAASTILKAMDEPVTPDTIAHAIAALHAADTAADDGAHTGGAQ